MIICIVLGALILLLAVVIVVKYARHYKQPWCCFCCGCRKLDGKAVTAVHPQPFARGAGRSPGPMRPRGLCVQPDPLD